jgi:glycolate oxidase FAD binding subunit
MAERRSAEVLTSLAASVVGAEHVRVATMEAELDRIAPVVVIEPPDPERAAAVLAWASKDGMAVAIQGGGTKTSWGPPLERVDVVLSTRQLSAVLEHRHGDLTATVQAGAPLARVNGELNAHHQWIPLDPPWAQTATIGGIIATNDSGPRRHRHGAPRDLIIGVTLARADGRLAKAGGIVVKNVAGYDMARLVTGSYGTLALIVDATFKLAPVASSSRTVIVTAERIAALGGVLLDLAAGQTVPSAVELAIPPGRLLIRFQAAEHASRQQASDVATHASRHGTRCEVVDGDAETTVWYEHERRPWDASGSIVKLSLLPARIVAIAEWLRETQPESSWDLIGRAGAGVLLLRLDGNDEEVERRLEDLRSKFRPGEAFISALRASPTLKRRLAAWDAGSDALPLMQTIKRQFDPAGILNPGRGPGGL